MGHRGTFATTNCHVWLTSTACRSMFCMDNVHVLAFLPDLPHQTCPIFHTRKSGGTYACLPCPLPNHNHDGLDEPLAVLTGRGAGTL